MKQPLSYFILIVAVLLWCMMLFIPPWIASVEHSANGVSYSFYKAYSIACHQYDSRSFHIFGYKLAVCARCTGIYLGFLFGCILFPLRSKKQLLSGFMGWIIAVFPMLLDVILNIIGVHQSTLMTRFVTGSFFGVGAAMLLSQIIIEAISEIISQTITIQGVKHEFKT